MADGCAAHVPDGASMRVRLTVRRAQPGRLRGDDLRDPVRPHRGLRGVRVPGADHLLPPAGRAAGRRGALARPRDGLPGHPQPHQHVPAPHGAHRQVHWAVHYMSAPLSPRPLSPGDFTSTKHGLLLSPAHLEADLPCPGGGRHAVQHRHGLARTSPNRQTVSWTSRCLSPFLHGSLAWCCGEQRCDGGTIHVAWEERYMQCINLLTFWFLNPVLRALQAELVCDDAMPSRWGAAAPPQGALPAAGVPHRRDACAALLAGHGRARAQLGARRLRRLLRALPGRGHLALRPRLPPAGGALSRIAAMRRCMQRGGVPHAAGVLCWMLHAQPCVKSDGSLGAGRR